MKKEFKLYLIIAFLLGMVVADFAQARKIPDIILPDSIDPDLREQIDYITDILHHGRYVMRVSSAALVSTDPLSAGEFALDDAGVNKILVISNGTTNYGVEVSPVP